jgi:DNA-binding transcriptional ArsR family regulator
MTATDDAHAAAPRAHNDDVRTLDLASLKVLAHPLRVQIIDELSQFGPFTASKLAERLGESSGATSYHLRQLAKHDFVREVEGKGTARERWWERVPGGISVDRRTVSDSVAGQTAAELVLRQWQENSALLLRTFIAHATDVLPAEWIDASTTSTANVRLTLEQLDGLSADVRRAIDAIVERYRDQETPDARPVQIQFNAFPLIDGTETPS